MKRHRKRFVTRLGDRECIISLKNVSEKNVPYLWIGIAAELETYRVGTVNGEAQLRALAESILDSLEKRKKRMEGES